MAGRSTYPWPIVVILAAFAATPAALAEPTLDILRLQPTSDGATNATIAADKYSTWTDGTERVLVLTGSILIRQDQTEILAEHAVVWEDTQARKNFKPTRIVVYAEAVGDKKVRIATRGSPKQTVDAAFVEFETPALGSVSGIEIKQSLADTPLFRAALEARGKPVPPVKLTIPGPTSDTKAAEQVQFTNPQEKTGPGIDGPKSPPIVTGTTVIPVPLTDERTIWISPRSNRPFNIYPVVTGKEKAVIITGGIKLLATFTKGSIKSLEVEADQVVLWQKDGDSTGVVDSMKSTEGAKGANTTELYMTGNVVLRYLAPTDATQQPGQTESRTLRADRVYYDVGNHRAIALAADLEYTRADYANTGHMLAPEIHQLSATEFTGFQAILHASRLPSDPGFEIATARADIYREPKSERRTIFGMPFRDRTTGMVIEESREMIEASSITFWTRNLPIFYLPRIKTDLNDPLGPFQGLSVRQDKIFGMQGYFTWDMLELVGLTPLDGEKWTLLTDYMSLRGPALGTNYTRNGLTMLGMKAPYQSTVKLYGVSDKGEDVLGGPRNTAFVPPANRGRAYWKHQQTFTLSEPDDLTVQAQVSVLSDRNFLEQYYENEYKYGQNQETFAWLKYQTGNVAATFLAEPDIGRSWVTETHWLPRVDGYWIGQSIFERLTYHTWASAGYAQLDTFRPPDNEYPDIKNYAVPPIELNSTTSRIDWMQKISAPFDLGPLRVTPYGVLDLAYYTSSVDDARRGRLYGGGGTKASVPLSRLYPDVESDLFNLQGLYHKNLFSVNYYVAGSTTPWTALPQLDRLNDDSTEAAWRNVTPWQPTFAQLTRENGQALALGSYNWYNPRLYAIRRLVDTKPDTLDDIQVLQMDWRQRLQTKRGYPGLEHTVDWFTLDLSASLFPAKNRDGFGDEFGFLEYAAGWNVGDRTSLFSNGWFDPFDFGARYWELGTQFSRDDRTQFTVIYKQVDPIQSRLVSASATYIFSPKYGVTFGGAYDFGYQDSLSNFLQFTRVGTDMQVTLGFTYNSIVKNFGVTFNVVPNLMANSNTPVGQRNGGGPGGMGASGSGGSGSGGGAGR